MSGDEISVYAQVSGDEIMHTCTGESLSEVSGVDFKSTFIHVTC